MRTDCIWKVGHENTTYFHISLIQNLQISISEFS